MKKKRKPFFNINFKLFFSNIPSILFCFWTAASQFALLAAFFFLAYLGVDAVSLSNNMLRLRSNTSLALSAGFCS